MPASATTLQGQFSSTTFSNPVNLKKIVLPAGLTTIPATAFSYTLRPADFTFEFQGNAKYSAILDGKALVETLDGGGKKLLFYPAANGPVSIPNDITEITAYAFRSSPITSIAFGTGLTQIPADCFRDCANLGGAVTIPANITAIGNSAFRGAGTAAANFSVTLPVTLTTIEDFAFMGSGLTSINMPASITSLGSSVFNGTRLPQLIFRP
jgi:hypothetical protein